MIARLSAAAATLLLLAACSGGAADEPAPTGSKGGKPTGSSGAPSSSGGTSGGAVDMGGDKAGDPLPPPPKDSTACKLPELKGTDVKPAFLVYKAGTTEPPATKGGKVDGKYTIDKATVYLPSQTAGLVKPDQSTGTVNGWAIFDGKNYRISLKADLQVQSVVGPKPQNIAVDGQGTFSATGSAIKLETSCGGAASPAAEVTFSENGARGTLVIKQATAQGDAYLLLEAARAQ